MRSEAPRSVNPDTSELRERLVAELRKDVVKSDAVASAFLSVAREAFVPFVRPEELYKNVVVATKWDRYGRAISSSSEPGIMAHMLEMLRLEQGQNVLEIGAATGYNAALLREIVGAKGKVTTIDVQPDLAEEARRHLHDAGYADVEVVAGDGRLGYAPRAPFDRIIATTSASDIPIVWWEQLRPDGMLVLPYRWNAAQAVFSLRRTPDGFESERVVGGGFMPMHGSRGREFESRFIGPRKDIGISPPRPPKGLDADVIFRLLNSTPRDDRPDAIAAIFAGEGPESWRQYYNLHWFLATRERLLEIGVRNPIYGFRTGVALAETSLPSLAVLSAGGPPLQFGGRPQAPQLLSFGTDATRSRLIALAEEYVAMGQPDLDRLRLSLTRSRSGRRWRQTFSYKPAEHA